MRSSVRTGTIRAGPPAGLLAAYRRSPYTLGAITVRIGRRSVALDAVLGRHRLRQAVLITAWNPRSRRMSRTWNRRMQTRLLAQLRGVATCPAYSGAGRWREDQVLAGLDPRRAAVLARLFRQAAFVRLRRGAAPRLCWIRYSASGV